MRPSTIWYVSKYVVPPHGSAPGGRGYELMRELARQGHSGVIVTSDANHLGHVPEVRSSMLEERRDGLRMIWLRTLKASEAKSLRRILGWLHFEWRLLRMPTTTLPRPDIVIVSSLSILTILNGLVLKRRLGARLVFEIRDIWPLTLTEEGGFSEENWLVRALGVIERLGYRRSDAIVGTMPNLGAHVAEVSGSMTPVHCVPMGYAEQALGPGEPLPQGYVDRYVPRGKFVVGYAGTIGITNALEPFFEAAQRLQEHTDIHFVVLGDGPLLPDFRSRYGDLANVTFAPKVPRESVQTVLRTFDLLFLSVHESKVWDYGQSLNKVIDYMLAAKPVVAYYSGYPSMIDEAGSGTFVRTGDPDGLVTELLRYRSMPSDARESMGRAGREWLLTHRSYPSLAQDYVRILESISDSAG